MINVRYTIAFCLFCYSTVLCCQTSPFLVLDWRNPSKQTLRSGQLSFQKLDSSKPQFDLTSFESNANSTASYLSQMKKAFIELPANKQNIIIFINGYSCHRKSSIIENGDMLHASFIDKAGSDIGLYTSFNWNAGVSYHKASPLTFEVGYYYADILLQVKEKLEVVNPELKIYLITHSMGNQVFIGLLKRLLERGERNTFDHHIMSAPDIETTIFEPGKELEHIDKISNSITIYTHSGDRILGRTTNISKQNRLGLIGLTEQQLDNISPHISIVDCSGTKDLKALNLGRHNYAKKSETVTQDIYYLLTGQAEEATKKRAHTRHPRKFYLMSKK